MAEVERQPRTGRDHGVPYKECVALRGPGRGGELHAAHPDVLGIYLTNPDDPKGRPVLWIRADGPEAIDEDGHTIFLHENLVDGDRMNIVPEMRRR